MQRRTALKQLGLMAGAAILLTHCTGTETATEATIKLHTLKVSGTQENLLAKMTGSLLPKTDIPGAQELNIHQFVLRMMDDCYEAEAQQKFMAGLTQAQKAVETKTGKDIEDCTPAELQAFFNDIEKGGIAAPAGEEDNLKAFYDPFRQLTIRGYMGSEYVMTNVFGYQMIPGKFVGEVKISATSDLKTILA
jgi:hypothetical protein